MPKSKKNQNIANPEIDIKNAASALNGYLRAKEPGMRERAYAWKTAIGLQKVDGLTPSDFLIETAKRNIEGEISLQESHKRLQDYYKSRPSQSEELGRVKETDLVSQHIAEVLAEPTFSLSPASFLALHHRLFKGVYGHAGKIRDYNITKSEWVLDNDTVRYESADVIAATLEYEFEKERHFDYKGLSPQEAVSHLIRFVSDVWQIHAFGEGNTRTVAIFIIKYLRHLGFNANNDVFANNAWYFRNALVRANYTNLPLAIHPTFAFLEYFFINLLFGGEKELKNRQLHISIPVPKNELVHEPGKQAYKQEKAETVAKIQSRPSHFVLRLAKKINGEMTIIEMMAVLKLGGRRNFLERYLSPAIEAGLIEMTQPDTPRSPTQKYRLTAEGMRLAGKDSL